MVQESVAWFPERDGDKLTRSVNVINANAEVTSVPVANAVSSLRKQKITQARGGVATSWKINGLNQRIDRLN